MMSQIVTVQLDVTHQSLLYDIVTVPTPLQRESYKRFLETDDVIQYGNNILVLWKVHIL